MILVFGFCLPVLVHAQGVGKVVMLSGAAWQVCAQDKTALQMQDDIKVGCAVVTDANSNVILSMSDKAAYKLGASTVFHIEHYHYDPDIASNNRVKTRLEQGQVRAITGAAGEANKQMYRMNTPLSAIGVRGTDYTVSHGVSTLVEIHLGSVAVSPLNEGCSAAGFGECQGALLNVLDASTNTRVLEINSQGQVVVKKQAAQVIMPREKVIMPEEKVIMPEERVAFYTKQSIVTDKRISIEAPVQSVFEWATLDATPVNHLWQQVATNKHYALYVDNAALPSGQVTSLGNIVNMQLTDASAQVSRGFGLYAPASIEQGKLQLNIASGSFNTQLSGKTTDDVWAMSVHGQLNKQGQLIATSDVYGRPTLVTGLVNNDATQAAYVFETLQPTGLVDGVARWQVKR
jgi:hypothetical protein